MDIASPSDGLQSPLAAFRDGFRADVDAAAVKPLAEYLARFPGDDSAIESEYRAAMARAASGAPPEAAADHVAHYRILRELGRGGQATVFLAKDMRLHRNVALKVLKGVGQLDGEMLERFRREAAVASKLDHPDICAVYDAGVDHDIPYIAMKYVEGETLSWKIATSRIEASTSDRSDSFESTRDPRERRPGRPAAKPSENLAAVMNTARTIEQAARALHVAHEAGVVHRDIKPGNIMITPSGAPVLLDFGLARDFGSAGATLTRTGDVFGTPPYMAPEQLSGPRARIDRRVDVWALGVTLYEALTLRRPFDAPTREALCKAIQFENPVSSSRLNRAIPSDLAVVVATALEKDPDRRYHSAEAFAEDLRRAREGHPIRAKPVSVVGRAWRWAKRRPARAALLASLAIGVPTIATLGGFLWASLPDIRAQKLHKDREVVEDHLENGFFALWEGAPAQARGEFDAALVIDPDDPEAIGGGVLASSEEQALAILDRNRELVQTHAGLREVERWILQRAGKPVTAADGPSFETAQDFFLAGYCTLLTGRAQGDDRAKFTEAFALFERAVVLSPVRRLLYHFHRACTAGRARNADVCRASAADLVRAWPNEPHAWFGRGFALFQLDGNLSIAAFHRAQELSADPLFSSGLGSAYKRWGRTREAAEVFQGLVETNPDRHSLWTELGHCLLAERDFSGSVAAYREAIRLRPGHAEAHDFLGGALEQSGLYEDAVAAYREALRLRPAVVSARYGLAKALHSLGRAGEAVALFREVVAMDPTHADGWCHLGMLLAQTGALDEAIRAQRESIRFKPDNAAAFNNLGVALRAKGCAGEAVLAHREAVRLDPRSAATHLNLAYAHLAAGRQDEAIAPLEETMRLDPSNWEHNYRLGAAYLAKARYDEAVDFLREAVRMKPNHADARRELGQALQWSGYWDDALYEFQEAVRLRPDFALAHCNLGLLLVQLGRPRDGLASLRCGHDLASRRRGWKHPSAQWVADAECFVDDEVAREAGVAAHLAAGTRPETAAQLVQFAGTLTRIGRPDVAARWFEIAAAESRDIADADGGRHRRAAAKAAMIASAAPDQDDAARATWRLEALGWLEADVSRIERALLARSTDAKAVRVALLPLLRGHDFDPVRSNRALAKLPEPERARWGRLWAAIDAMLDGIGTWRSVRSSE